jgi:hypothetical protein
MNDDYLTHIKDEFGVTLPASYIEFMRNYPPKLETTKLDLGSCQEAISERVFLKSPEKIFKLNRDVRTLGVSWLKDGSGWPSHFFVIGDDDCGNYYAIDTKSDSGTVHFYNHEVASFTHQAESFQAFANQKIEETLEYNRDEHRATKS